MQSLLVLYMVNYLLLPGHIENVAWLRLASASLYGGLEGQPLASAIFGTYTALVYLTPILGGILADRCSAAAARAHRRDPDGARPFPDGVRASFLFALLCLVLGVGCFKGNIASQVGALYGPNDLRRAMAFQIFYIAHQRQRHRGAADRPARWARRSAGIGASARPASMMVVGLIIYLAGQRYLPAGRDRRPRRARRAAEAARARIGRR